MQIQRQQVKVCAGSQAKLIEKMLIGLPGTVVVGLNLQGLHGCAFSCSFRTQAQAPREREDLEGTECLRFRRGEYQ